MGFTNQKSGGIVEIKHCGTVTVNAHLVLNRPTSNAIALAYRTILCRQEFRNNK